MKIEGGSVDAGVVIQDCLQICANILNDSETCQRLFFGMGTDWILRLADYFDPLLLENLNQTNGTFDGSDSDISANLIWFEQPIRLACAILALTSLHSSLSTKNSKHQMQIATATSVVVPAAAFWIARRGPTEMVNAGLTLLNRVVENNPEIGSKLSNAFVKVTPAQAGKNFPIGLELPLLNFGWKPLPSDDRKFISILALLAERYIFPVDTWTPTTTNSTTIKSKLVSDFDCGNSAEAFSIACLKVFERILNVNSTTSDLIIQYILAPPPPPNFDADYHDNDAFATMQNNNHLEVMKPIGTLILNLLVEGCNKLLSNQYTLQGNIFAYKQDIDYAEKSANLLSLIFIYGSQLSKELSTAITTNHTSLSSHSNNLNSLNSRGGGGASSDMVRSILPFLLASAGRTARIPGGSGFNLLVAILRLLSAAVSSCERAAKHVFNNRILFFIYFFNLKIVLCLTTTAYVKQCN
jgi:hypothetical protein